LSYESTSNRQLDAIYNLRFDRHAINFRSHKNEDEFYVYGCMDCHSLRLEGIFEDCKECEERYNHWLACRKITIEESTRFREATKLVAGLYSVREIKFALIHKVHKDNVESAIVRYMAKEALPKYYFPILRSQNCIDRLVEGIFYKVCKIQPSQKLVEQISALSNALRTNTNRITAYDRVTRIQQFIYQTIDQYYGAGAARLIPVAPMKNALSAARLHLNIIDVVDHQPNYSVYIDSLSTAKSEFEYVKPRPSTAPLGKQFWPRWRVRHLHPLSYYFTRERRALLEALKNLDENMAKDEFVYKALFLYAEAP
jgi:hypothetical protein